MPSGPHDARHPIRVVARRTGLKQDLIRAWERRYKTITPQRTAGKHRLYSDHDVERLTLLRRATLLGRSIGQVAELDDERLRNLVAEDERKTGRSREMPSSAHPSDSLEALLSGCLEATRQLDGRRLQFLLKKAEIELSQIVLIQEVLVPLLDRIGILWSEGTLRPLHEHMASAVIRSFLGNFPAAYPAAPRSCLPPHVVIATPRGQRHEFGALLAANAAAAGDWEVTYLGPDLPGSEIAAAAQAKNARAVALSIVYPGDDPRLGEELYEIRRQLGQEVPLIVGGRSASEYAQHLQAAGAMVVDRLEEFRTILGELQRRPQTITDC